MNRNDKPAGQTTHYLPLGMSVGIGVGMLVGALTGQMPIGISIGIGLGMAAGGILDRIVRKK